MMVAGYETTSTALGYAAYELALNPEIQRKIQAEIDENFADKVGPADHAQHELTSFRISVYSNCRYGSTKI